MIDYECFEPSNYILDMVFGACTELTIILRYSFKAEHISNNTTFANMNKKEINPHPCHQDNLLLDQSKCFNKCTFYKLSYFLIVGSLVEIKHIQQSLKMVHLFRHRAW